LDGYYSLYLQLASSSQVWEVFGPCLEAYFFLLLV